MGGVDGALGSGGMNDVPWNGSLLRLLLNSWQMLCRREGNGLGGKTGSGGISSTITWFTQMLNRRLGGSLLGNSSGRLGFGATHLGSSFGVGGGSGGIAFVRLNLGSLGFTVGKNGLDPVDPGDSGECCMLLSIAFLRRGSLMLATEIGPPGDRPSEDDEYVGEISILSS